MAIASAKTSRLETLDSESASLLRRRLNIANMNGIKNDKDWPMYAYSYFLIPGNNDQIIDPKEIEPADFVRFWRRVDDTHKIRRLLLDYVCILRTLFEKLVFAETPVPRSAAIFLYVLDDYFLNFLRSFVFPPCDGLLNAVQQALSALINCDIDSAPCLFRYRREETISEEILDGTVSLDEVNQLSKEMHRGIFNGFLELYAGWKASSDPKRYLEKLRLAAPHWSVDERKWFWSFIPTDREHGESKTTYISTLVRSLGGEKFGLIAFGKEKFCANCGQSSYTADDRLWACKLCVVERVQPKARYCNVECQKADWIKHKAEVHSSCASCGRKAIEGETKLRACTKCLQENPNGTVRYCDEKCQRAHWPEHKKMHRKKERGESKKM